MGSISKEKGKNILRHSIPYLNYIVQDDLVLYLRSVFTTCLELELLFLKYMEKGIRLKNKYEIN